MKLAEIKTVFSIGALVFEGDLPASIFHMQLIENDASDWKAKTDLVAIFHTNAARGTLHNTAYNADRNLESGNPFKATHRCICRSAACGFELCGATAKAHHWGNVDLLPGIKVNLDAMARTTQLVQEGFVKITE